MVRGAGCNQWRPIVSCCSFWHAADPSLTNKDGKQDAKEDDEKDELHVFEPVSSERAGPELYASGRIIRLRHYEGSVKGKIGA
jgi:hypothetical protein